MKALPIALLAALASVLFAGPAQAQTYVTGPGPAPYRVAPYRVVLPGYHHHPWGYRYGGTTAAGSYLRGMAHVIAAQGQYNVNTAQAAVLAEEARRASIENHRLGVETYFANRKTNRAARAEQRGPRPTGEQLARLASSGTPDRLTQEQLDPATGRVAWPAALLGEEFAAHRADVEGILYRKLSSGALNELERARLDQAAGAMLAVLKSQIREMPPMQYTKARGFLESLDYEAQLSG